MSIGVPGFSELPVRARARAVGLAALQASLGRFPAERALGLLPRGVYRRLRVWAAPLRVPRQGSKASLDRASALAELESAGARIVPSVEPRVSLVIPTAGATDWLALCLAAVASYTEAGSYEVVVVDDASPEPARVRSAVGLHPGVRLERSARNRGFAASVNAGVAAARADRLVILNDDVVVTPGWLERLNARLDLEPRAAWVGPATNDSGDEASVDVEYASLEELLRVAAQAAGSAREVDKLALHCALLRRSSFARVGGLDEGYARGMFEDDDLAMALRQLGERVILDPGVFVHHAAGATLRALSPLTYFASFEVNRRRFEARWGVAWRVREGRRA